MQALHIHLLNKLQLLVAQKTSANVYHLHDIEESVWLLPPVPIRHHIRMTGHTGLVRTIRRHLSWPSTIGVGCFVETQVNIFPFPCQAEKENIQKSIGIVFYFYFEIGKQYVTGR